MLTGVSHCKNRVLNHSRPLNLMSHFREKITSYQRQGYINQHGKQNRLPRIGIVFTPSKNPPSGA